MSIDVCADHLIPITTACREFPGRAVHISTLIRWTTTGIMIDGGQRVRLEIVRICGRTYTTTAAIARFIAAQNADQSAPAISPQQRARQSAAARKELESMGV